MTTEIEKIPPASPIYVDTVEDEDTSVDLNTEVRYRTWKKNAPYLYDYCSTVGLVWPSLTIEFLPDVRTLPEGTYQRLLYGTFTNHAAQDQMILGQAFLPTANPTADNIVYNPDKQEYEMKLSQSSAFKTIHHINHFGDVNRARYMPQNPDVIASANHLGQISIFERTKLPMRQAEGEIRSHALFIPTNAVEGEIFAIDWNAAKEGELISGDANGNLYLYDITSFTSEKSIISEKQSNYMNIGINDIQFMPQHHSLIVIADEGGTVSIYDTRQKKIVLAHQYETLGINLVSANPSIAHCIAGGSSDGAVAVYDLRRFGQLDPPLYKSQHHADSITQLKWHPHHLNVVGSSSRDRLVRLFDVASKSLLFSHEGHMYGVNDFDWSYHDEWLLALVGDDNALQIWRPSLSKL